MNEIHGGIPDPGVIDIDRLSEARYWAARLGVTRTRLQQAIDAVGTSASDVEAWLSKHRS